MSRISRENPPENVAATHNDSRLGLWVPCTVIITPGLPPIRRDRLEKFQIKLLDY